MGSRSKGRAKSLHEFTRRRMRSPSRLPKSKVPKKPERLTFTKALEDQLAHPPKDKKLPSSKKIAAARRASFLNPAPKLPRPRVIRRIAERAMKKSKSRPEITKSTIIPLAEATS